MMVERFSLEARARVHAALADPARLAIVDGLTIGDASPGELGRLVGQPTNLVAHHLGVLDRRPVGPDPVGGRSPTQLSATRAGSDDGASTPRVAARPAGGVRVHAQLRAIPAGRGVCSRRVPRVPTASAGTEPADACIPGRSRSAGGTASTSGPLDPPGSPTWSGRTTWSSRCATTPTSRWAGSCTGPCPIPPGRTPTRRSNAPSPTSPAGWTGSHLLSTEARRDRDQADRVVPVRAQRRPQPDGARLLPTPGRRPRGRAGRAGRARRRRQPGGDRRHAERGIDIPRSIRNPGPTRWSAPPTSWSAWAAATRARCSPASATRTGARRPGRDDPRQGPPGPGRDRTTGAGPARRTRRDPTDGTPPPAWRGGCWPKPSAPACSSSRSSAPGSWPPGSPAVTSGSSCWRTPSRPRWRCRC